MNERLGIIEERQARLHAILSTARMSQRARAAAMGRHYCPVPVSIAAPKVVALIDLWACRSRQSALLELAAFRRRPAVARETQDELRSDRSLPAP